MIPSNSPHYTNLLFPPTNKKLPKPPPPIKVSEIHVVDNMDMEIKIPVRDPISMSNITTIVNLPPPKPFSPFASSFIPLSKSSSDKRELFHAIKLSTPISSKPIISNITTSTPFTSLFTFQPWMLPSSKLTASLATLPTPLQVPQNYVAPEWTVCTIPALFFVF